MTVIGEPLSVSVDHVRLQEYHVQLWLELRDLLDLYASLCTQHKEQPEAAVARATLFQFFGAIETSIRVIASACFMVSERFGENSKREPDQSVDVATELMNYLTNDPIRALTRSEKLFLREEEVTIGSKDFREHVRPRFWSFEA